MDLRRIVLEYLATHGPLTWHGGHDELAESLQRQNPQGQQIHLMGILWQLLSEGLLFVDYRQPHPEHWAWVLSERGSRVASSEVDYEPDDPEGYLRTLRAQISELDELVFLYTQEALGAYAAHCYLASTVMLGVASERTFQLLGEAFASWLPPKEAEHFRKVFDSSRYHYIQKFIEFRKRIEPRKSDIPPELSDNMSLTLDAVLDLLRINRNEAGHPTGRRFTRDEAYTNLQVFARYLKTLYALRVFFLEKARQATSAKMA